MGSICNECRRKNYCTKPCKNAKLQSNRAIYNTIMNHTGIGTVMDMMQSNMNNDFINSMEPERPHYTGDNEPWKR